MKLATYTTNGRTLIGIVVGEQIVDTGFAGAMIDLIPDWDTLRPDLEGRAAAGSGVPLSSVKLEAPIQRPGKYLPSASTTPTTLRKAKLRRRPIRSGSRRRKRPSTRHTIHF